jgi:hypothetical protein
MPLRPGHCQDWMKELNIFERRILRYIFGPVEENGTWRRRRYNYELYKLFNESAIIGYIKAKKLK